LSRRAAIDDGLTLLMAVEPDPAQWPLHVDLASALAELEIRTVVAVTGPGLTEKQWRMAALVPGLDVIDTGLNFDPRNPDMESVTNVGSTLASLARDVGADIIQLDNAAVAATARFPCPLIVSHQGCTVTGWERIYGTSLPGEFAWRADLIRSGLEAAYAVVCPTVAHGRMVKQRFALSEMPHIVNVGRSPLNIRGSAQHDYVLTAGRLWDEGSNVALLDAAARRVGVPVRAAGPVTSPKGEAVMFDNVHCLGNLDEAEFARWLGARPVFVSTALYEPLGLSVLAAASAGCALILSDIPEYRELWEEVAIFVNPHDERGFGETIVNLVGDDFERAVLGRAARERAALYTPQAMAAQLAALYRSLLPAVNRPVLAARAAA
jgi:glycosyltransferase involved in cell wall biosynthesis